MELVKHSSVKRTIRAYCDREGRRVLEIVEYEPQAPIQSTPKKRFSKLEIVYLVAMSFLGFGVAVLAMSGLLQRGI